MPHVIGLLLALALSTLFRVLRFDRDRALYPFILMVVASYYVLFAVMGGRGALVPELLTMAGFFTVAGVGFRTSLWVVAAGLLAHGVMDSFHGAVVDNPGVPAWWPAFCATYDVVAAVVVAWLLARPGSGLSARPISVPVRTTRSSSHSVAWMVVASLAGAVVLSLVLVLFVVPGAPENVISAAVLFALAAASALLSALSARWSDQPQRWARIAAAWLALAGAVLLAWPGAVSTNAIAWVAPVLLLALVFWTALRVRRELHGRVRTWVVYPGLAVLAVASAAAGYETVRESSERRAHPMRGQLIEVADGRRMYLSCAGSGSPVVVLVPGAGEPSSIWGWIAPDVARDTRVCVYDRAGRGWSDPVPEPQDGFAVAADLATLLTEAREAGPYVLVGHSFGGLYVRSFAARYPGRTAGMVLLDASGPGMFSTLPDYPVFYERARRVSALFPSLARFGVGRLAYRAQYAGLPREAGAEDRTFWFTARHARSLRDEWAAAPRAMQQADSLVTLGDRPLIVVTALQGAQEGWEPLQREHVTLSSNGVQWTLPTATHSSLVEDSANAAISGRAVRDVVAAVRTSQPLEGHRLFAAAASPGGPAEYQKGPRSSKTALGR